MSTRDDQDPDGLRLPVKIDTTPNGEFLPIPLSKANRLGNRKALESATDNSRRVGRSRRNFLVSSGTPTGGSPPTGPTAQPASRRSIRSSAKRSNSAGRTTSSSSCWPPT